MCSAPTRAPTGWRGPGGERIHVTEKNARDALEFLRGAAGRTSSFAADRRVLRAARPGRRARAVSAAGLERRRSTTARRSRLPCAAIRKYLAALPPFLSNAANEGRVRYHWRFDTPERYQAYMTRVLPARSPRSTQAIGRLVGELRRRACYRADAHRRSSATTGTSRRIAALPTNGTPYEESVRVPLVVRDPRLGAGAARRGTPPSSPSTWTWRRRIVAAAGLPVPARHAGAGPEPAVPERARPPAWRDEFFYEHPTVLEQGPHPLVSGRDPPRLGSTSSGRSSP
ncbi:MAG: hypothetical protein MZV63_16715, partial [Marinilabiliales bacterium]|nr:hypothetical protein [Marinilabiliales bacterium]